MTTRFFRLGAAVFVASWATLAWSAESASPSPNSNSQTGSSAPAQAITTDPSYRLSPGDTVAVAVQGESDMSTIQTIARTGDIRLVYIKEDVKITDKTIRDAERYLENLYVEKKVMIHPVVNLTITSYNPREVTVVGAVKSPGRVPFQRDVTTMDVVDVINAAGGFMNLAKKDAVVVTHKGTDGKETQQTVDVEKAMSGRRKVGPDRADVVIYPGDRIFVPESIF
jgi:polysaccharide export outer membrane protein